MFDLGAGGMERNTGLRILIWKGAARSERNLGSVRNSSWRLHEVGQDVVEDAVREQDGGDVETDGAVAVKANAAKYRVTSGIRKRGVTNEIVKSSKAAQQVLLPVMVQRNGVASIPEIGITNRFMEVLAKSRRRDSEKLSEDTMLYLLLESLQIVVAKTRRCLGYVHI